LKRDLAKAAAGGVPTLNKFLADKFDPNKEDNITPEIVQTKRGFVVMYGGRELPDYAPQKSLDALIGTVEGRISGDTLGTLKTLAQIRQAEAQAAESAAGVGLKGAQADYYRKQGEKPGLKQKVADFKEVYGREPTEDEKGILAGLANKPREFTAADVNARAKLMVEGGMMDPDDPTKPISPQKAIQIAQAELSGQPYVSAVDQLILDMQAARGKTPAAVPKKPGALTVATPVGQQLLDVGNVIVPPQPYARPFTTKEERLRGLSIPAR
jgi:hypothetical protein